MMIRRIIKKREKTVHWTGVITIATALILLFWIGWMLLYPYDTTDIKSIEILNKQVKIGEEVHYIVDYCKYTDKSAILEKTLINDFIINFPSEESKASVGCFKGLGRLKIPNHAQPGIYSINWKATYNMNVLREITVEYKTDEFEIIK